MAVEEDSGRFQQEAHTSNIPDQPMANDTLPVNEGLGTDIIAIKCCRRLSDMI